MLKCVKIGLAWTLPLLSVALRAALVMYSHGVGLSMAASATGSLVECHKRFGGVPRPSWWHSTIFLPLCRLCHTLCPLRCLGAHEKRTKFFLHSARLFVTLASPKFLPLKCARKKNFVFLFALSSLIRNFGFAEVTLARACKNEKLGFSFCTLLAYS